ncbi:Transcription initiation factor IID, 18kDa subunit [Phytophthora cinnamomi]|uniref:Transcription initiation factor IID, 18kDa subunit n=1 Tax=Phytophthora cinnamomi TaxID=4785 RepID=UPI00355A8FB4|nr:Transcription initiation factor IID, 18kDa subunit [Phytophthora cinnamomi]
MPSSANTPTKTNAWKTLPLEQKKKILEYIRDKRQRKAQSQEHDEEDDAKNEDKQPPQDPAAAVRTDPYLKTLLQRSLRSAGPVADAAALPKHPNSAYVAPVDVPH